MAKKQSGSTKSGRGKYRFLKVLCAATIVLSCIVLFIGGAQSGVRTVKTIYKCLMVTGIIGIIFGVVIRVVQGYEETHGG